MCSGRIDLEFVLRAFSNGMDGVFIGACRLNECNYITHGNRDALNMVLLCKRIMEHIGLNPERLRIEFMSSGEGSLFAEVINDYVKNVKELGPLAKAEGIDENELKARLDAVRSLVPYIKLVERERLRMYFHTEDEYNEFFASEEVDRLFRELIVDKLTINQILLLMRERPLSTGEISEILGLSPSDVSRYLKNSAREGLVRFDEIQKRFVPV
jgi:F420-non-reducing hydrogenase iron-sulfur subunit